MNLREGEAIKKDIDSARAFSFSGLILSVSGMFSSPRKTASSPADSAEKGSVICEASIAENTIAENNENTGAENQSILNSSARERPRHEKSVIELIKLDFKQHRRAIIAIGAILAVLSAFFFYTYMKAGIVLLSLIIMGAVSRAWQRFFPLSFGIELVMLATVISGIAYGAFAGLAVGLISMVLSTLLTQEDPGKMWPAFLTISAIGFLAGTLSFTNVALWGVIFTVLYDAIISAIYLLSGHSAIKTLIFDATHVAFNYFVFYHVAPVLISIVA